MESFLQERLKNAEKRLEVNPYDIEAWSVLIRDAQGQRIEDARAVYERCVAQFPTCGRYWKIYIEQEMKARAYEKVEKLFQRCLMKVLNMDLWRCYLNYVKETKGSLPTFREKMAQAYDFTLDKMGMDINSLPVWNDYVTFLKSVEAVGSYAENQRITAVRKVYQKGIVNPMTNIEQFWKDYVTYEQSINPLIAEKMTQDRSRDYMNARRATKEYEANTRGLNKNVPSVPPTGLPEELKQVELWKNYIEWEKGNPTRTEDLSLLTRRVMFAYEQCLLCLGHHADIWYEAAMFLENSSKNMAEKGDLAASKLFADDVATMFERAITTLLDKNQLLYYAYADFEESRMNYKKVHEIYDRFINIPDVDPTLTYVQYMKFARRAEGIKSARLVFKRAREDARSGHHVYVAAALMEYYCSKDKSVAFKIFELGLKKYADNADYIVAYIDYLSHLNEDNNTRVLFERVLTSGQLTTDKSVEIWNRFLEFESNIGDLTSIVKVEKRRSQAIAQHFAGNNTALLVDRYRFRDLMPCTSVELISIGYKPMVSSLHTSNPTVTAVVGKKEEGGEDSAQSIPRPDISQMLPFKPKAVYPNGAHCVPGGTFPMPSAATDLMTKMPPPASFKGPFVAVDRLMDMFLKMKLPENPLSLAENGIRSQEALRLFDTAVAAREPFQTAVKRAAANSAAAASNPQAVKRNAENSDEEEDDDSRGLNFNNGPANDIYRARQQKKDYYDDAGEVIETKIKAEPLLPEHQFSSAEASESFWNKVVFTMDAKKEPIRQPTSSQPASASSTSAASLTEKFDALKEHLKQVMSWNQVLENRLKSIENSRNTGRRLSPQEVSRGRQRYDSENDRSPKSRSRRRRSHSSSDRSRSRRSSDSRSPSPKRSLRSLSPLSEALHKKEMAVSERIESLKRKERVLSKAAALLTATPSPDTISKKQQRQLLQQQQQLQAKRRLGFNYQSAEHSRGPQLKGKCVATVAGASTSTIPFMYCSNLPWMDQSIARRGQPNKYTFFEGRLMSDQEVGDPVLHEPKGNTYCVTCGVLVINRTIHEENDYHREKEGKPPLPNKARQPRKTVKGTGEFRSIGMVTRSFQTGFPIGYASTKIGDPLPKLFEGNMLSNLCSNDPLIPIEMGERKNYCRRCGGLLVLPEKHNCPKKQPMEEQSPARTDKVITATDNIPM